MFEDEIIIKNIKDKKPQKIYGRDILFFTYCPGLDRLVVILKNEMMLVFEFWKKREILACVNKLRELKIAEYGSSELNLFHFKN